MELSAVGDLVGAAWTLAKEVGKGGGGGGEEPTVCAVLLPIGLAVLLVASQSLRRRLRALAQGRPRPPQPAPRLASPVGPG